MAKLSRPSALFLVSTFVLGLGACTTVHSTSDLAFDEIEVVSADEDNSAQEALPAPAQDQLDGLEVSACASGCGDVDPDPEQGPNDSTEEQDPEDSTQEQDTEERSDTDSSTQDQDQDPSTEDENAPKIDFLFVIDNSGSMADEQAAIAASAPGFIASIQEKLDQAVSVHAGVILTGEINHFSRNFGSRCEKIGSLLRETDGKDSSRRQCYPDDQPKYSTRSSDLAKELECALRPGTGGSGEERPMDALLGALSPELNEDPECNQGFFRDDALLVVTILTDEEDDRLRNGQSILGSKGHPEFWTQRLIELRGGDEQSLVVLGLIGTEESQCQQLIGPRNEPSEVGAQISKRLETFVNSFGDQGLVGDICAPRYDRYFSEATGTVYRALLRWRS